MKTVELLSVSPKPESTMREGSYFLAADKDQRIMWIVNSICSRVSSAINDNRFDGLRFSDVRAGGVQISLCTENGPFVCFGNRFHSTASYKIFGIYRGPRADSDDALTDITALIDDLVGKWPRDVDYEVKNSLSLQREFAQYGTD